MALQIPTSSVEPGSNPFGYKQTPLYQRRDQAISRKPLKSSTCLNTPLIRLFQVFSDYQYFVAGRNLPLTNRSITLHCAKADGFGDIGQIFLTAEVLRKNLSDDFSISIVIDTSWESGSMEKIQKIFHSNRFSVEFLDTGDYYQHEEQIAKIIEQTDCLIGISVPIGGPELHGPLHRSLREYGFSRHPDCQKEETLAMGFDVMEEGINFPTVTPLPFHSFETEWLRNALGVNSAEEAMRYFETRNLYHMYMRIWTLQMVALYSVAEIEKEKAQAIDVFLPLNYSLKEWVEWGALDLDVLKANGIGRLIRVTSEGEESIKLGDGKEMRILSGSVSQRDLKRIQQHSERFFGCSGDGTLSEAIALYKVPFQADLRYKPFAQSWNLLLTKEGPQELKQVQDLLDLQAQEERDEYDKNTPRNRGWFHPEPCYDLSQPHSVPRKSMSALAKTLPGYGRQIANLYLNTPLAQKMPAFAEYLRRNYNLESRLVEMAYRGLILKNYPHLLEIEQDLKKQFLEGRLSEEEVVSRLHSAIAACAPPAPATDLDM